MLMFRLAIATRYLEHKKDVNLLFYVYQTFQTARYPQPSEL